MDIGRATIGTHLPLRPCLHIHRIIRLHYLALQVRAQVIKKKKKKNTTTHPDIFNDFHLELLLNNMHLIPHESRDLLRHYTSELL